MIIHGKGASEVDEGDVKIEGADLIPDVGAALEKLNSFTDTIEGGLVNPNALLKQMSGGGTPKAGEGKKERTSIWGAKKKKAKDLDPVAEGSKESSDAGK